MLLGDRFHYRRQCACSFPEQLSWKLLMDNPHLEHFYTHVVMDCVKSSYALPLSGCLAGA